MAFCSNCKAGPRRDRSPTSTFIVSTVPPSLLRFTTSAVIHSNYALLLARVLQTPLLHSSTPSSSPTLLTLCCPHLPCPPSLRLGAWTWSSILPHVSLDAIHKFLYTTKCWTCSTGSLPTEDLIANHPFGPAVPEEPLPVCLCNLSCTTLSALGFCSLYFTKRVVIIVPLVP